MSADVVTEKRMNNADHTHSLSVLSVVKPPLPFAGERLPSLLLSSFYFLPLLSTSPSHSRFAEFVVDFVL